MIGKLECCSTSRQEPIAGLAINQWDFMSEFLSWAKNWTRFFGGIYVGTNVDSKEEIAIKLHYSCCSLRHFRDSRKLVPLSCR
jgi:hypothetical protein